MSSPRGASDPTKWGVSTLQLQRPGHLFFDGAVRPWEDGMVHVSTEAVVRGLNVFEGLKGHWQQSGELAFRTLRLHYERMQRSARLLHIPVDFSYDEFVGACSALAEAEQTPDNDLYIRATLIVVEGHYGEGTVSDLVLTAYQQKKDPPTPIAVGTTTWQRSPDLSLPIRIKTGANYVIARLARIEGKRRGYEDMIVLNASGRVAESVSACVLMVRDGVVSSPPPAEGALESITLALLAELGKELGVEVVQRPIDRSELYIADELALTGTITDVTRIDSIDDMALPDASPVLDGLRARYRAALTGSEPHAVVDMTVVARSDDD